AVGTVAVAVGGAVSVNRISGENEASIRNARLVKALAASGSEPGVVVHATDSGSILAGAGGLGVAVSPGGAAAIAAGVSATDNDVQSTTRAVIDGASTADDSTRTEIQTQTGLDVQATNESRIVSVSIGVAAAVAAGQGFA